MSHRKRFSDKELRSQSISDLERLLCDELSSMPRRGFRYGAHFKLALRLFEELCERPDNITATLRFLENTRLPNGRRSEKENLLHAFQAASLRSFHHLSGKLIVHTKDLSHLSESDEAYELRDQDEETYGQVVRRMSQLRRLNKAMRQVGMDDSILNRNVAFLKRCEPIRRALDTFFVPIKQSRQPDTFRRPRQLDLAAHASELKAIRRRSLKP